MLRYGTVMFLQIVLLKMTHDKMTHILTFKVMKVKEVDGLHYCSLNDGMDATDLYILPKTPAGNQLEGIKRPSGGDHKHFCMYKYRPWGIHYMLHRFVMLTLCIWTSCTV